jgi:hypothetical protein
MNFLNRLFGGSARGRRAYGRGFGRSRRAYGRRRQAPPGFINSPIGRIAIGGLATYAMRRFMNRRRAAAY